MDRRRIKRYHNQYNDIPTHSVGDVIRWLLFRPKVRKPGKFHSSVKAVPAERVESRSLQVTFINHSTVLIQCDGYNILTDPIWSMRCGPLGITGPKRLAPPGVLFENLPQIDLVLLSHNHYDHADLPTLKKLASVHQPIICVPKGVKKWLERHRINGAIEFDWWQEGPINESLHVAFVPAQHYARRGLFDHNRTLWGGFVIKTPHGTIFFACDTAYGPHFAEIRKRYGAPGLALLPIGSYEPRWLMQGVHMSPEDAVMAHLDLNAAYSLGIHHGTFKLGDEDFYAPITELHSALIKHQVPPEQFLTLKNGESWSILF